MLKVAYKRLSPAAKQNLWNFQDEVDAGTTYAKRVSLAKGRFSARNKSTNPTFAEVRSKLTAMCSGARRCMYCEDSVADEVEHFKPKDLYPEVVFVWMNYLYACGACNGPKNNQFSILDAGGQLLNVTRPRRAAIIPPQTGEPALIDPRREDPLAFMMLDLQDTFEFTPTAPLDSGQWTRADYTINVLRLKERDYLVQARENAFGSYRARLKEYINERDKGASGTKLAKLKAGIRRSPHPTVWAEMQRQHSHPRHPELQVLFAEAPEALTW